MPHVSDLHAQQPQAPQPHAYYGDCLYGHQAQAYSDTPVLPDTLRPPACPVQEDGVSCTQREERPGGGAHEGATVQDYLFRPNPVVREDTRTPPISSGSPASGEGGAK